MTKVFVSSLGKVHKQLALRDRKVNTYQVRDKDYARSVDYQLDTKLNDAYRSLANQLIDESFALNRKTHGGILKLFQIGETEHGELIIEVMYQTLTGRTKHDKNKLNVMDASKINLSQNLAADEESRMQASFLIGHRSHMYVPDILSVPLQTVENADLLNFTEATRQVFKTRVSGSRWLTGERTKIFNRDIFKNLVDYGDADDATTGVRSELVPELFINTLNDVITEHEDKAQLKVFILNGRLTFLNLTDVLDKSSVEFIRPVFKTPSSIVIDEKYEQTDGMFHIPTRVATLYFDDHPRIEVSLYNVDARSRMMYEIGFNPGYTKPMPKIKKETKLSFMNAEARFPYGWQYSFKMSTYDLLKDGNVIENLKTHLMTSLYYVDYAPVSLETILLNN